MGFVTINGEQAHTSALNNNPIVKMEEVEKNETLYTTAIVYKVTFKDGKILSQTLSYSN